MLWKELSDHAQSEIPKALIHQSSDVCTFVTSDDRQPSIQGSSSAIPEPTAHLDFGCFLSKGHFKKKRIVRNQKPLNLMCSSTFCTTTSGSFRDLGKCEKETLNLPMRHFGDSCWVGLIEYVWHHWQPFLHFGDIIIWPRLWMRTPNTNLTLFSSI